jgi:imidazolonepropionase-like amidohydrolase
MRALMVFFVLSVGAAGEVAAQLESAPPIAFRDVTVVPMDAERVLPAQTVIVRGERIDMIGPAASTAIPAGATVIEGQGRYLMPGLAEMHAHVPGTADPAYLDEVLFLYVANGITLARGMLGQPAHLAVREQLAAHERLGPRLITSGPSLSGQSAPTPADARRMVLEQAQAGYDFIKLHPGLTRAVFDAAVEAGREADMTLAGHVSEAVGVARALEAGQVTIDHLDGYVEYLVPTDGGDVPSGGFFGLALADRADTSRIPAAAQATLRAGVWNVPTQSLIEHWLLPEPSAESLAARPEMAYVSPAQRQQWVQSKQQMVNSPAWSAQNAERLVEVRRQLSRALRDAGAGLLLGSDAPQVFNVPGFSIHHELAMMVAAGLTPYEALRSGTINPAVFFGAEDEYGRVAAGLVADLLLVDDNPLDGLATVARPAGVMVRGRWLDRAELDDGLAAIAARHAR